MWRRCGWARNKRARTTRIASQHENQAKNVNHRSRPHVSRHAESILEMARWVTALWGHKYKYKHGQWNDIDPSLSRIFRGSFFFLLVRRSAFYFCCPLSHFARLCHHTTLSRGSRGLWFPKWGINRWARLYVKISIVNLKRFSQFGKWTKRFQSLTSNPISKWYYSMLSRT